MIVKKFAKSLPEVSTITASVPAPLEKEYVKDFTNAVPIFAMSSKPAILAEFDDLFPTVTCLCPLKKIKLTKADFTAPGIG